MYPAATKFLALYHHLPLPGIGNFSVQNSSAEIDFTERTISPGLPKIIFSKENGSDDKIFYEFLSRELNITQEQARHDFANFTTQLQDQLDTENKIHLNGIGDLLCDSPGNFSFQPEETFARYAPLLTAERVIRKNAMHMVMVGELEKTSTEMQSVLREEKERDEKIMTRRERWWIPAAILAFVGFVALIVYYTIYS